MKRKFGRIGQELQGCLPQNPEAAARLEALDAGLTPDAILTDAEEALDALGELTGRTAREEIVSRIFSRFCVGK